jgi:hypothetical protein
MARRALLLLTVVLVFAPTGVTAQPQNVAAVNLQPVETKSKPEIISPVDARPIVSKSSNDVGTGSAIVVDKAELKVRSLSLQFPAPLAPSVAEEVRLLAAVPL